MLKLKEGDTAFLLVRNTMIPKQHWLSSLTMFGVGKGGRLTFCAANADPDSRALTLFWSSYRS